MSPPDSAAIGNALVATLLADATLMALVPDGVWKDEAWPGKKRFVIVSFIDGVDVGQFGAIGRRRAYEDKYYLVKAVMLTSSGGNIQQAAARIDALLEDAVLTVPGYSAMACYRVAPGADDTEVDALDPSIRWQHLGGRYRVQMAITAPGIRSGMTSSTKGSRR
jgi:hypothetical protein